MREMVRSELVEPINPIELLENYWEVSGPFIKYLNDEDEAIIKRRRILLRKDSAVTNGIRLNTIGTRIHADKFDSEVFYQLEQLGLAVKQGDKWYRVEKETANELMTFLASVIGGKLKYQPTTDVLQSQLGIPSLRQRIDLENSLNNKREVVLSQLIPFPEQIDIYKLRRFKDENLDLLKSFKNKVELIVLNPSIEVDSLFFTESVKELGFRKDELSAKMNESRLGGIFFGTVCGVVGAVTGLAAAATPGAIIGAIPGFVNAIYSALKTEKAEGVFDQSGMKYLALVDKRLRNVSSIKGVRQ